MHLEEDTRPREVLRVKLVSPTFKVRVGCSGKHRFTGLCRCCAFCETFISGIGSWEPWTKQAVGFIPFGGFAVVILLIRFFILHLRLASSIYIVLVINIQTSGGFSGVYIYTVYFLCQKAA